MGNKKAILLKEVLNSGKDIVYVDKYYNIVSNLADTDAVLSIDDNGNVYYFGNVILTVIDW